MVLSDSDVANYNKDVFIMKTLKLYIKQRLLNSVNVI